MPELPEVITIKNDLKKEIVGKKITGIKRDKKYPLKPSKKAFKKDIIGHKVENVLNVAKLLAIKMSSKKYIGIHLSMTGILLFNKDDPFTKIAFKFEGGDKLNYSTVRKFGFLEVWSQKQLNDYKHGKGKFILNGGLDKEMFINLFKNRRGAIKNMLLNQKIVSGIGNIYANDALYMSGIHPEIKANKLSEQKLGRLYESLKEILNEAIKNRGSSIDRYRDIYNKKGKQQKYFRVYGRAKEICKKCNGIIKQTEISNRSTYFCENCQPKNSQEKLL